MKIMKSFSVVLAVIACFLLAATPATAQRYPAERDEEGSRFRLSLQVWRPDATGFLEVLDEDLRDEPIDLEDDLGLTEAENGWLGDVVITLGKRHRLIGSAVFVEHSALRTVEETFEFGGEDFVLTDEISSDLEFREGHGLYNFLAVARPEAELGALGGFGYLELTATVSGTLGTVTTKAMSPTPLFGANLRINPDGRFVAYGEVIGFPEVEFEEFNASLLDARGHVEIYLIDNLAGIVGYRYYEVDFKDTGDVGLQLTWQGLTFGGMVRF